MTSIIPSQMATSRKFPDLASELPGLPSELLDLPIDPPDPSSEPSDPPPEVPGLPFRLLNLPNELQSRILEFAQVGALRNAADTCLYLRDIANSILHHTIRVNFEGPSTRPYSPDQVRDICVARPGVFEEIRPISEHIREMKIHLPWGDPVKVEDKSCRELEQRYTLTDSIAEMKNLLAVEFNRGVVPYFFLAQLYFFHPECAVDLGKLSYPIEVDNYLQYVDVCRRVQSISITSDEGDHIRIESALDLLSQLSNVKIATIRNDHHVYTDRRDYSDPASIQIFPISSTLKDLTLQNLFDIDTFLTRHIRCDKLECLSLCTYFSIGRLPPQLSGIRSLELTVRMPRPSMEYEAGVAIHDFLLTCTNLKILHLGGGITDVFGPSVIRHVGPHLKTLGLEGIATRRGAFSTTENLLEALNLLSSVARNLKALTVSIFISGIGDLGPESFRIEYILGKFWFAESLKLIMDIPKERDGIPLGPIPESRLLQGLGCIWDSMADTRAQLRHAHPRPRLRRFKMEINHYEEEPCSKIFYKGEDVFDKDYYSQPFRVDITCPSQYIRWPVPHKIDGRVDYADLWVQWIGHGNDLEKDWDRNSPGRVPAYWRVRDYATS